MRLGVATGTREATGRHGTGAKPGGQVVVDHNIVKLAIKSYN